MTFSLSRKTSAQPNWDEILDSKDATASEEKTEHFIVSCSKFLTISSGFLFNHLAPHKTPPLFIATSFLWHPFLVACSMRGSSLTYAYFKEILFHTPVKTSALPSSLPHAKKVH